jgi:hypothetical protein
LVLNTVQAVPDRSLQRSSFHDGNWEVQRDEAEVTSDPTRKVTAGEWLRSPSSVKALVKATEHVWRKYTLDICPEFQHKTIAYT